MEQEKSKRGVISKLARGLGKLSRIIPSRKPKPNELEILLSETSKAIAQTHDFAEKLSTADCDVCMATYRKVSAIANKIGVEESDGTKPNCPAFKESIREDASD